MNAYLLEQLHSCRTTLELVITKWSPNDLEGQQPYPQKLKLERPCKRPVQVIHINQMPVSRRLHDMSHKTSNQSEKLRPPVRST